MPRNTHIISTTKLVGQADLAYPVIPVFDGREKIGTSTFFFLLLHCKKTDKEDTFARRNLEVHMGLEV